MSDINISIPGGESKRLLTGGKYCPNDIVVTAEAAGSGGGVETCTVTLKRSGSVSIGEPTFYYTNGNTLVLETFTFTADLSNSILTVPVNSIISITDWASTIKFAGLCNEIFNSTGVGSYQITGDCTLTVAY